MDPIVWSIILLMLGLGLVLVEVFIPSGGIIGFLSVGSLVTGIGLAFYHRGAEVGFVFVAIAAIGVPLMLTLAFRWWPNTPMGKRLLLQVPTSEEVLPDSPMRRMLRELLGKVGVAKSLMLPSGAIEIEGKTIDALSDGVAIEPGQRVRVVEVRGNRVLVRPVSAEEEAAEVANKRTDKDKDDILSQPIESLGLEPFDDPLA